MNATAPTADREAIRTDAIAKLDTYIATLASFAESYNPEAAKRFAIETSPTLFLRIAPDGKTNSTGILHATLFTKAEAVRIVRDGLLFDGAGKLITATARNVNAATREAIQQARSTIEMLRSI